MLIQRLSLFTYLLLIILICSSFVLGLVIWSNRMMISGTLFAAQDEKFRSLTHSATEDISRNLEHVEETIAQNVMVFYQEDEQNREKMSRLMTHTLRSHSAIYGMEIIFTEEGRRRYPNADFTALYAWQEESAVKTEDRNAQEDYQAEWFTKPYETKKQAWSEPYRDKQSSKRLMVTYSFPILGDDGCVEAIVTADIAFDWLTKRLLSLPLGKTGVPILLSAQQQIIVYPDKDWEFQESLQSLAAKATVPKKREAFESISDAIRRQRDGCLRFFRPYNEEWAWIYFDTLEKNGWTIGCILPDKEVLGVVSSMNRRTLLYGFFGILLLIIPSWLIARSVAGPLRHLSTAADEISHGRFDAELPRARGDGEIARLVTSFDQMRTDLVHYIRDITESTRQRERFNAELNVAHSIQLGMVPKDFSPPKQFGIDLFAMMEPAQEVGGDLYDFAMLDDDHLYFCIGDVSGKGIPASLFMAVGKTLLKSTIQAVRDPAAAFELVNTELMHCNEASLFITAFCGIFNQKTGEILFACAGHNPPALIQSDGRAGLLAVTPNFPLALDEGTKYVNGRITLEPGQILFLYTDGVTDAENPAGEYFGESGLLQSLAESEKGEVEPFVRSMMASVHAFADGAKQSDDVTILSFGKKTNLS